MSLILNRGMVASFLVAILIVIILPSVARSDNSTGVGNLWYLENRHFDAGGIAVSSFQTHRGGIEFELPLFDLSLVARNRHPLFNFRLLTTATSAIGAILIGGMDTSGTIKPYAYPLFFPNATMHLKLFRGFRFTVKSNTDFLFVRTKSSPPGVILSPSVGFTICREDKLVGIGGISVLATHSRFLNFDSKDENWGWGVLFSLWGDAVSH